MNFPKMILTKEDFQRSFFYSGSGTDIQPLLRFSNITDCFVYANLYLNKKTALEELERQIDSTGGKLKITGYGADFKDKDLDIDFDKFNENASEESVSKWMKRGGFFSMNELWAYKDEFHPALKQEEWGKEIFLERKIGSIKRSLRLLYFTAEALAAYLALSHIGTYPPKIICSIQSGLIELPGGIFERMISEHKTKPFLWLRGFRHPGASLTHKQRRAVSPQFSSFNYKIQSYADWQGDSITINDSKRFVACFSEKEEPLGALENEKEISNGSTKIKIIRKPFLISDARDFDIIITNKNLAASVKGAEGLKNILFWEDMPGFDPSAKYNPFSLVEAMECVKAAAAQKKARKILMTPAGLEDEGEYLSVWLKENEGLKYPSYIELRFTDYLDYFDLRQK